MRHIKDFFIFKERLRIDRMLLRHALLFLERQICRERKQPLRRLTLVKAMKSGRMPVFILKYILLVGTSLLALIVVAGHLIDRSPAESGAAQTSASSLELLRKMANHGESRPFASAAVAGPFLAMPAMPALPVVAAVEAPPPVKPDTTTAKTPSSALNAQARLEDGGVAVKPAPPAKKVASRKPKPRLDYVENVPRGPIGFFGTLRSW